MLSIIQPLIRSHVSTFFTTSFPDDPIFPSNYLETKEIMPPYHRVRLSMFPFVLDWNTEIKEKKIINPIKFIKFPKVGEVYDIGEPIIEIKLLNLKESIILTNPLPGKIHDINHEFIDKPNEKSWLYIVHNSQLTHFK